MCIKTSNFFINPPQTFTALNDRLAYCLERGNLRSLQLINVYDSRKHLTSNFTIQQVLEGIRFPLPAYDDVNEVQIQRWKHLMIQLFPPASLSGEERTFFTAFSNNFAYYSQPSPKNHPLTQYRHIEATGRGSLNLINHYEALLSRSESVRLERALAHEPVPKNPLETAKKLHFILNSLLMENHLIFLLLQKVIVHQKSQDFLSLAEREKKIIPVHLHWKIPFFPDKELRDIEDPAKLAFLLQIKSAMQDLHRRAKFTDMDNSGVNSQSLTKIIQKLESLKNLAQEQKAEWVDLIDNYIHFGKHELLSNDCNKHTQVFEDFLHQVNETLLSTKKGNPFRGTEKIVAPFACWSITKMGRIEGLIELLQFGANTLKPPPFPPYGTNSIQGDHEEMDEFCKKWLSLQQYQQQLYQFTYQTLQEHLKTYLPQASSKTHHEWLNCNKVMFVNGAPLPSELVRLEIPAWENITPIYQTYFGLRKKEELQPAPLFESPAPKAQPQNQLPSTPKKPNANERRQRELEKSLASPARPNSFADLSSGGSSSSNSTEENLSITEAVSPATINTSSLIAQPVPGIDPDFFDHFRVGRWRNHPSKEPLDAEDFPEYQIAFDPDNKARYHQDNLVYHGFTPLADRFYTIGSEQKHTDPDTGALITQYFVPAEMQRGTDSPIRGIIVWAMNQEKVCFHRYFHKKENRQLIKIMMEQTFFNADFPSLAEAMKSYKKLSKDKKVMKAQAQEDSIEIDPHYGKVTIQDSKFKLKLTLFPTSLHMT